MGAPLLSLPAFWVSELAYIAANDSVNVTQGHASLSISRCGIENIVHVAVAQTIRPDPECELHVHNSQRQNKLQTLQSVLGISLIRHQVGGPDALDKIKTRQSLPCAE